MEEEHAIKEILQDIALYGLWRADFFEVAGFQGGTRLQQLMFNDFSDRRSSIA